MVIHHVTCFSLSEHFEETQAAACQARLRKERSLLHVDMQKKFGLLLDFVTRTIRTVRSSKSSNFRIEKEVVKTWNDLKIWRLSPLENA